MYEATINLDVDLDVEDLAVDVFAVADQGLTVQSLSANQTAPARSCLCSTSVACFW